MSSSQHWNTIFKQRSNKQLGWYEEDVHQTLKLLQSVTINSQSKIFLPGAGTSQLVDVLLETEAHITANDLSNIALEQLADRIGENASIDYLVHNMARPFPQAKEQYNLWIDRAVLHFLLDEKDIQQYFLNLSNTLQSGGFVLFAEFTIGGAKKCAGLNVHQYTAEELSRRLGTGFQLERDELHTFINPQGDARPYVYTLFKKQ